MSSLADKNLSKSAQDKINNITAQAQSGQISWSEANKQANAVRASEGANYTVSAKGTTSYNDGSSISSYKSSSKVSGGGSAQRDYDNYGGSSPGGSSGSTTSSSGSAARTQQRYGPPGGQRSVPAVRSMGPDTSKRTDLAGQSVKQGHYTVTYNDLGYAVKSVKDEGASATSTVKTTHANDSIYHQLAYEAASRGDWDTAARYANEIAFAAGKNEYGTYDMTEAHKYMNELGDEFLYNANNYYNSLYDQAYGEGASALWDASGGAIKSYKQLADAVGEEQAQKIMAQVRVPSSGQLSFNGMFGTGSGGSQPGGYQMDGLGTDYMSFEDFLAGTGYDQYADATQAAIRAAVQNAVNGYRDQIDTTNQDSDELARQAYIAKMLGQKNLDQQMAVNGYAGGMADSQRIATETDYQNQLSDIEKQRLATVKELERAITNAQLTGDMQTAQELASYLQQIQGQWVNYVQNQQQMAQQNYWNQQNLDNQNYWNQQNLNAQNTESARSWAMQQIAMGIMPDDEILSAAGISKQAAQQQVALNLGQTGGGTLTQPAQQTVRRTTTGGGYNNGGLTSSQVMQLQQALGVTADGLWGSNSQAIAGGRTADEAWSQLKAIEQEIRMNRTDVGRVEAIRRLQTNGQITETMANYFLNRFGI